MSRARFARRMLLAAIVLLAHALAVWGLAEWDAGGRLLSGGSGRWLAVASIGVTLVLRVLVFAGLPVLASWWCAQALTRGDG